MDAVFSSNRSEMEKLGTENGGWIGGELYYRKRRNVQTREDVLYGVFQASSSDRRRKRRKGEDGVDLTEPVSFVSTGTTMRNKELDKNSKEDKNGRGGGKRKEACFGDVGKFEQHTKGIGMKLLEKMGYKGGGLGKNKQGIAAPIEPIVRPKGMGMGYNDYKEVKKTLTQSQSRAVGSSLWRKGKKNKADEQYVTVEEVLEKKEEEQGFEITQVVIDMRGKHVRVLTNLDNLNAQEETDNDIPMPELQYNIRLIVDMVEADIQKIQSDLRKERDIASALQAKKAKLAKDAAHQMKQLGIVEEIMGVVTLDDLNKCFSELQMKFPCELVSEAVLPAVQIACSNTWEPRDPEPMLRFMESWEKLMPASVTRSILDAIVLPMLSAAVDSWDASCKETVAIHVWVHPWLPRLGTKLEALHPTILTKLRKVLDAWHPSDASAYAILSPWKTVFDSVTWENLMREYILPKLQVALEDFQIAPANQNLDQFNWVLSWASALPIHLMVDLLERFFFVQWLQVLYDWLGTNPNMQEVREWYFGWKGLLPPELQAHESIRYQLIIGLSMMKRAIEGQTIAPPGLRENLGYLGGQEQRATAIPAAMSGVVEMSFKEAVEEHAQRNGLKFVLKPNRMHNGFQIYGYGNVSIYMDSLNQRLYALTKHGWVAANLGLLLRMHHDSLGGIAE